MQKMFSYLAISANRCKPLDEIAYITGMDRRVLTAHVRKGVEAGEIAEVKTEFGIGFEIVERETGDE